MAQQLTEKRHIDYTRFMRRAAPSNLKNFVQNVCANFLYKIGPSDLDPLQKRHRAPIFLQGLRVAKAQEPLGSGLFQRSAGNIYIWSPMNIASPKEKKPVSPPHRLPVGQHAPPPACQGGDQHVSVDFRQVEIGDQPVQHFEAVAGMNEDVRPAGETPPWSVLRCKKLSTVRQEVVPHRSPAPVLPGLLMIRAVSPGTMQYSGASHGR